MRAPSSFPSTVVFRTPTRGSQTRVTQTRATQTRASQTRVTQTRATQTRASQTQASQTQASQTQASQTRASQTRASQTRAIQTLGHPIPASQMLGRRTRALTRESTQAQGFEPGVGGGDLAPAEPHSVALRPYFVTSRCT